MKNYLCIINKDAHMPYRMVSPNFAFVGGRHLQEPFHHHAGTVCPYGFVPFYPGEEDPVLFLQDRLHGPKKSILLDVRESSIQDILGAAWRHALISTLIHGEGSKEAQEVGPAALALIKKFDINDTVVFIGSRNGFALYGILLGADMTLKSVRLVDKDVGEIEYRPGGRLVPSQYEKIAKIAGGVTTVGVLCGLMKGFLENLPVRTPSTDVI